MLLPGRASRRAATAAAVLVVLVLVLWAIALEPFHGTVAGTVRGTPCASVEAGLPGCSVPMRHLPLSFQSLFFTATTVTDANGHYSISLGPDIYGVSVGGGGYPVSNGPTRIVVGPRSSVRADFIVASHLL